MSIALTDATPTFLCEHCGSGAPTRRLEIRPYQDPLLQRAVEFDLCAPCVERLREALR